MITESTIYWITRLDYIHTTLGILCGFSAIGSVFIGAITISEIEDVKTFVKHTIIVPILLILSIIGVILTPTTKEMCAIKVIPAVANNESVKEIGSGITELAKDWLNELKPTKTLDK